MTAGTYDSFSTGATTAVTDAVGAGKDLISSNFPAAMVVTGAFVLWRIGKRVVRSIA
jgi:hypothetical protein